MADKDTNKDDNDDVSDWRSTSLSKYSIIREAKRSRSSGGRGRIPTQQQQQQQLRHLPKSSKDPTEDGNITSYNNEGEEDQFTQVDSVFGSIIPKRYSRFTSSSGATSTQHRKTDDQTTVYSTVSNSKSRRRNPRGGGATVATGTVATGTVADDEDEETLVTYYSLLQGPNRFKRNSKNNTNTQNDHDNKGGAGPHTVLDQRSMRLLMVLLLMILASLSVSNVLLKGATISTSQHDFSESNHKNNNGIGGDMVVRGERFFHLLNFFANNTSTHTLLTTVGSPQFRALDWIANHDEAQLQVPKLFGGDVDKVDSALATVNNDNNNTMNPARRLVQRFVLAVFYFSTNLASSHNSNEGWKKKHHHWLSAEHECKWKTDGGVRACDSNGQVTDISIWNNLVGTIPNEIGKLTELRVLYLARNDLHGTIPSSIGQLKELTYLGLHHNQLVGTFPSQHLGALTRLRTVYLEKNDLTGTIKRMDPFCQLKYDAVPPPGEAHSGGVLRFVTSDCRILVDWKNPEITCNCCTKCFTA